MQKTSFGREAALEESVGCLIQCPSRYHPYQLQESWGVWMGLIRHEQFFSNLDRSKRYLDTYAS